ncbi:hypothetical protein QOZ88_13965 [Blastococcus sp. BMG 814]|uniref:Uncharacterized protein n=1 Tax=Blastococcus carthaginiensis TaxID=3050034 RepID=A0ABT9IDT7_9ACTN|nr:hypothetical protein [Blastococcus carthaginiensis]MDP5183742.1 hypothetical protein [Blastococcus carthaginiensis]
MFEPLPGYPACPFRGTPPERDKAVLEHRTRVTLAPWQAAIPSDWLPAVMRGEAEPKIWLRRRDVLSVAEAAHTPVGAFQTYVAAAAWGSRPGREVGRRLLTFAGLTEDERVQIGTKLAAVTDTLVARGAEAGYEDLIHGDHHVSGIRTSFGTKYLYFAGYCRVTTKLRPLILDKNTALAVTYLTGRTCAHNLNRPGSDGGSFYWIPTPAGSVRWAA